MKSFHQFCEQAAAAAPAPAPAATAPKVAKPQAKAKPKVTPKIPKPASKEVRALSKCKTLVASKTPKKTIDSFVKVSRNSASALFLKYFFRNL